MPFDDDSGLCSLRDADDDVLVWVQELIESGGISISFKDLKDHAVWDKFNNKLHWTQKGIAQERLKP
jgi:hypothetical protein